MVVFSCLLVFFLYVILSVTAGSTDIEGGKNMVDSILKLASWLIVVLVIYLAITGFKPDTPKKNIPLIKKILEQNQFVISRYVGDDLYSKSSWLDASPFSLYVDDENKQWFLTSAYSPEIGKICKYDDLLDYDTFDTNGIDIMGEIFHIMVTAGSILGGAAVGSVFYRSLLGGIVGGVLGSKAGSLIPGKKGVSYAYGIKITTKDNNVSETCETYTVFDFGNIILQSRARFSWLIRVLQKIKDVTKHGYRRISIKYNSDFKVIKEMVEMFDYIYNCKEQGIHQAPEVVACDNLRDKNTHELNLQVPKLTPINDEKFEKLRMVKGLLDDGILTQEEFEEEKRKILKN